MGHAEIFNDIYARNLWSGGSGAGSTPQNAKPYVNFLTFFLSINRIASVVDAGCGDWQFSRHMDWSWINYTGLDVSSVVLQNTGAFARPNVRFLEMDAVQGDLPGGELLLMKDVLQHWSNADILAFLPRLSRFKFALLTNFLPPEPSADINRDIAAGAWRGIDLARAPFGLPGAYVYWYAGPDPKGVFLWQNPAWPAP